jgi:hypothetical protein
MNGGSRYRHFRHAIPEERAHAANRLDHQGDIMKARAAAIRRRIAEYPKATQQMHRFNGNA